MTLTEEELLLAEKVGFPISVFELLKRETKNTISQYHLYNDSNDLIGLSEKAIISNVEDGKKSIKHMQKWLIGKKYFAFLSKIKSNAANQITILKAENQFDILQFQKTDGGGYDITTNQVIAKLALWDKLFGVNIIGADNSWVLFEIKKMTKDINWFAQELYEFCPDILDQGFGEIENLIGNLKKSNEICLWWD